MEEEKKHFMRQAIALAKEGKYSKGGGAFGAVIVRNGTLVSAVPNTVKGTDDCTQHAELRAIQEACSKIGRSRLSECEMYTSCEPCMMCLGACHWAKFKTIYFGASALDAKEHGYIYSDLYYAADHEARHKEFNMVQCLRAEAIAVWEQ